MKNPCLWRCQACDHIYVRWPARIEYVIELYCSKCCRMKTFQRDVESFGLSDSEMIAIGMYFEALPFQDWRPVQAENVRAWFHWICCGAVPEDRMKAFLEADFVELEIK